MFIIYIIFIAGSAGTLCHAKVPTIVSYDDGATWIVVSDVGATAAVFNDALLFWSDIQGHAINLVHIATNRHTAYNSSYVTIVKTNIASPEGIAVDWLNDKLYWTDSGFQRLEVSQFDGSNRKVLYWQNVYDPKEIVVEPLSGYIFWIDANTTPYIERAGMDGSPDTRAIIVRDQNSDLSGLAVDVLDGRLYWVKVNTGDLFSSNLVGQDRKVISTGVGYVKGLVVHGKNVVWMTNKSVFEADKKGKGNPTEFAVNLSLATIGMNVLAPRSYPVKIHVCGVGNGGCSNLCLTSPVRPYFKCACPTGIKLRKDNRTCERGPQQLLLFAQRMQIGVISLDSPDMTSSALPVYFQERAKAVDVDYDPITGYVFWADEGQPAINMAFLNGTGQKTLVSANMTSPDGIAVNYIHRVLYWTDRVKNTIEMVSLKGEHRQTVIEDDLDEPRAICIDPVAEPYGQLMVYCSGGRFLFWSDWGSRPRIERAHLHGGGRQVLVSTLLKWPNGLCLDRGGKKLYYADAHTDRIEVVNVDGSGRTVLVSSGLQHIFGLTILDDYLYWSDWHERSIERVNKKNGKNRQEVARHLTDIFGIRAVNVHLVCPFGSYGAWCAMRCGNCFGGDSCHPQTGVCHNGCAKGVVMDAGKMCVLPCTGGTYGQDCSLSCGHCAAGEVCDRANGTCPNGCKPGFTGSTCWQRAKHHASSVKFVKGDKAIVATVIVSIVVVVCLAVVVIVVYLWRNKCARCHRQYQRADDRVVFITEMEEEGVHTAL